jgi:hypothetical protein
MNLAYFRTCYFKLGLITEKDPSLLKFGEVCWEILNIFKENFPSKIEITYENLDQLIMLDHETIQTEILRRSLNTLSS